MKACRGKMEKENNINEYIFIAKANIQNEISNK